MHMRSFTHPLSALAFAIIAFFSFHTSASADSVTVNPNANEQVVFYIPHQDDEALTFGVSILNHVEAGYDVHIVLLTDGAGSGVRKRLNMTPQAFTEARNNEFLRSVRLMGVKSENIRFMNYPDGTTTVEQVYQAAREYQDLYPTARHKSYSYTDAHPDHKNAGLGLKRLVDEGITDDVRYYLRRGMKAPEGARMIREAKKPHYDTILRSVAAAYSIENPRLGLYGIGNKSVPSSFKWLQDSPKNYYHR